MIAVKDINRYELHFRQFMLVGNTVTEINKRSENKGEKRGNGCGIERNLEKKGENERKKRTSEKKRERKEGENYKTENGGKLEMN